jgi:hypothetical protein
MYRHRYFDLYLHDDRELARHLGGELCQRQTLHEWPLSCVQRLVVQDGRRLIYKAQAAPSVEADFYEHARSPLLIHADTIFRSASHTCLLLEYIEEPLIRDLGLPVKEIVRIGKEVSTQIAGIDGDLPCLIDIGDETRWGNLMAGAFKDMRYLVAAGRLCQVDEPTVKTLEQFALGNDVLAALRIDPGFVHGDLAGDNLFVLSDRCRVIDWQYPRRAPRALDLAILLESLGINPVPYAGEGIVRVMYLLRIWWLAQCATRWIPEAASHYDRMIINLAERIARPT